MSLGVVARRRGVRREDTSATVVLVRGNLELAAWPVSWPRRPDLSVVEELARLHLAARRVGCAIRLQGACAALGELLDLVGLRVEMFGEAEDPEEVGVEEVVVTDDPVT